MRIVLDTNILVRANVRAQGPARELLLRIAYGKHTLITSAFLLREVEGAVAYPRLRRLWRLTSQDVREHVQFLVDISELVEPVIGAPVVRADPNDDPVVYAAISGKADVLCTLDRDLFEPGVLTLCQSQGISVLSDVELLHRLL
jgi:putative PIN family toxin of toxin-antitoxin system